MREGGTEKGREGWRQGGRQRGRQGGRQGVREREEGGTRALHNDQCQCHACYAQKHNSGC